MKDKVMYSLLDSNGFVLPIKLGSYCGLDSGWNLAVRRQQAYFPNGETASHCHDWR